MRINYWLLFFDVSLVIIVSLIVFWAPLSLETKQIIFSTLFLLVILFSTSFFYRMGMIGRRVFLFCRAIHIFIIYGFYVITFVVLFFLAIVKIAEGS